jgi:hypothetical protein
LLSVLEQRKETETAPKHYIGWRGDENGEEKERKKKGKKERKEKPTNVREKDRRQEHNRRGYEREMRNSQQPIGDRR